MSDYEMFKNICEEIDDLIEQRVTSEDETFITWHTKAERFIRKKYGDGLEFKKFSSTHFTLMVYTFNETHEDFVRACRRGLESIRGVFKAYLEEMEDEKCDERELAVGEMKKTNLYAKVFVVHGHDEKLKEAVARVIEKQGIQPIILSEQLNQGATIIEKFEKNSDVGAAICLFTADDEGKACTEEELKKRARQNVVFETGYFMGRLGRDKIIMIVDPDVEAPSDIQGVVYTNNTYWQMELLKELKGMGFSIDMNKIF